MCKCGCDTRLAEQKAFEARNAALWEAAQTDARDLSYSEAVAQAARNEVEDHDRWEQEVTAFVKAHAWNGAAA
jgi:hypothetical protein